MSCSFSYQATVFEWNYNDKNKCKSQHLSNIIRLTLMTHRYGTNATMRKIVSKTSFYSSILNDVRGGCIHSIFFSAWKTNKKIQFFWRWFKYPFIVFMVIGKKEYWLCVTMCYGKSKLRAQRITSYARPIQINICSQTKIVWHEIIWCIQWGLALIKCNCR